MSVTPSSPESLFFTTEELAARWRVAPKTIARWRRQNLGPRFRKLGKRVVYSLIDVLSFEDACTREPGTALISLIVE